MVSRGIPVGAPGERRRKHPTGTWGVTGSLPKEDFLCLFAPHGVGPGRTVRILPAGDVMGPMHLGKCSSYLANLR